MSNLNVSNRPITFDQGVSPSSTTQSKQPSNENIGREQQGAGGLTGKTISIGDGKERDQTISHADKAKGFFKTLGKGVALTVLSPLLLVGGVALLAAKAVSFIPRLVNTHVLEPRAELAFQKTHAGVLSVLKEPTQDSVLNQDGVLGKLTDHATSSGKALTQDQIKDLVATGENIVKQLKEGNGTLPLTIQVDGKPVEVPSSVYTTRAIAWFMMAQGASQDLQREKLGDQSGVKDMVTGSGSMLMKDPGNKLYNFLNSAPTCAPRMSTHFAERAGHTENYKLLGLIPTSKVNQRGIEDYQSLMPGNGGTMLFDKLAPSSEGGDGQLFVKIESVGCPPYFCKDKHESAGHAFTRFFVALDRNIGHATTFLNSLSGGHGAEAQSKRLEHVYKGSLKEAIGKPFEQLINKAIANGVLDGEAKAIAKQAKKFGLPYVKEAVEKIKTGAISLIKTNPTSAEYQENMRMLNVQNSCDNLLKAINKAEQDQGAVTNDLGLVRRGAEAHIDLWDELKTPQQTMEQVD